MPVALKFYPLLAPAAWMKLLTDDEARIVVWDSCKTWRRASRGPNVVRLFESRTELPSPLTNWTSYESKHQIIIVPHHLKSVPPSMKFSSRCEYYTVVHEIVPQRLLNNPIPSLEWIEEATRRTPSAAIDMDLLLPSHLNSLPQHWIYHPVRQCQSPYWIQRTHHPAC